MRVTAVPPVPLYRRTAEPARARAWRARARRARAPGPRSPFRPRAVAALRPGLRHAAFAAESRAWSGHLEPRGWYVHAAPTATLSSHVQCHWLLMRASGGCGRAVVTVEAAAPARPQAPTRRSPVRTRFGSFARPLQRATMKWPPKLQKPSTPSEAEHLREHALVARAWAAVVGVAGRHLRHWFGRRTAIQELARAAWLRLPALACALALAEALAHALHTGVRLGVGRAVSLRRIVPAERRLPN